MGGDGDIGRVGQGAAQGSWKRRKNLDAQGCTRRIASLAEILSRQGRLSSGRELPAQRMRGRGRTYVAVRARRLFLQAGRYDQRRAGVRRVQRIRLAIARSQRRHTGNRARLCRSERPFVNVVPGERAPAALTICPAYFLTSFVMRLPMAISLVKVVVGTPLISSYQRLVESTNSSML